MMIEAADVIPIKDSLGMRVVSGMDKQKCTKESHHN